MKTTFMDAVKNRRSIYGLSSEKVVEDERIFEIIQESVKHSPTAFNSQSGRVVVLLHQHHHRLWDITKTTLKKIVPSDQFNSTEQKMDSFKKAYGTVLFFEDQSIIENLQKEYSLYAEKFPTWSKESSGMLQFVLWTALEEEGFGANLQHYNPLIDDQVKESWNIPDKWELIAQMPFGKPTEEPGKKEFDPLNDRIKIYR